MESVLARTNVFLLYSLSDKYPENALQYQNDCPGWYRIVMSSLLENCSKALYPALLQIDFP